MIEILLCQPALQRSSDKMIKCDFTNLELFKPVGTFHSCDIVHPVTDGNKIRLIYLFLPKNKEKWYVAFKPVRNKSGNTVSIVYELVGNVDCEFAALALLHLLKTTINKKYPLALEIPEFENIINEFEGVNHYREEKEWHWWRE